MGNKKIVFVTIIIITFIIIIVINFNRKSNDTQNKSDNSIQTGNKDFGYFFDETNSVYTIYDKNTNEVVQTTMDETMLKMYLDNPDFDPTFPGIQPEYNNTIDLVELETD